jgi:alkanesulfonate monooxygenase SsuD/methylene tetrahydromethanopterin reductase-like flavin-dependent oxidoreductase (luciferase family)
MVELPTFHWCLPPARRTVRAIATPRAAARAIPSHGPGDRMQFSIFYQLPAVPGRDAARRFHELRAQVRTADELGFHAVWLAEGHFHAGFSLIPAPLTVAAALAAETRRIRLGTGVVQLPLHHPVAVAEQAALVDVLSNGRLLLGVGRGSASDAFQAFGVPWAEREARFREGLDILEQTWATERVTYRGQHYRLDGVGVQPRPVQRQAPLYLAANSGSTAALAGARGLGLMVAAPLHPWPHDLRRHVDIYRREYRPELGRTRRSGHVAAVFFVFPGRDRADVRGRLVPSLRRNALAAHLPFDVVAEHMAVFGSVDECVEKIGRMAEGGVIDELVCWFAPGGMVPHEQVVEAMQLFRERVVPGVPGALDPAGVPDASGPVAPGAAASA